MICKDSQEKGLFNVKDLKLCEKLLENTREGIVLALVNSDGTVGNFILANITFCRMSGYSSHELAKMNPSDLSMAVKDKNLFSLIEQAMDQRHTVLERNLVRKDGSSIPVRIRTRLMDADGQRAILSLVENLTEQKLTEVTNISHLEKTQQKLSSIALKEGEERFRQIFMQTDDAILILDGEDHHVIDLNPAALQYGYSKQEINREGVGLLMKEEDFERWNRILLEKRDKDIVSLDCIIFGKKDGEAVTVSFRGQRIRLPESELIYCSFRDITDRIRTEEEAKLMQAKLIQGNKMTSLGLMVSSVAHDINNPNNYIMFNSRIVSDFIKDALPILEQYCRKHDSMMLGGLSAEEFNDTLPKLLEGISDGTRMITRIVNDLKDFVRQNLQTVDYDVNVNEVVERSRSLIENHIRKFTEKFSLDLTEELLPIRGNTQQLVQVLVNIILNALESLPDKKHGVHVATMASSDSNHVEIKVRDEGCGMPVEVRDRALEPFFSTRLDKGGTGLGLTICNSILCEHEGKMLIESTVDVGTTITLILPTEKYLRECGR